MPEENNVPSNTTPQPATPRRLLPAEIVRASYGYLSTVVSAQSQKISEVRIEELSPFEDDNNFWTVVLSYDVLGEFSFNKKREYKEFKIHAFSGDVIYMKIFNPKVS